MAAVSHLFETHIFLNHKQQMTRMTLARTSPMIECDGGRKVSFRTERNTEPFFRTCHDNS